MAFEDDGVGFDMVGAITTEKEKKEKDLEAADFEMHLKKKKKKKKKKRKKAKTDTANTDSSNPKSLKSLENTYWQQSDTRDYPYTVLLDRIFRQLNKNNSDLMVRQSHKLSMPQTALHGSRKTGWGNFQKICFELDRKPEHVKLFFLTEMNTAGNLDGSGHFIIKGRWRPKQIESLLKKYIREYVTCQNCRSPKTVMEKDNSTRLNFLRCKVCEASRSVCTIKAGYVAVGRGDRRAARNAAK